MLTFISHTLWRPYHGLSNGVTAEFMTSDTDGISGVFLKIESNQSQSKL